MTPMRRKQRLELLQILCHRHAPRLPATANGQARAMPPIPGSHQEIRETAAIVGFPHGLGGTIHRAE